MSFGLRSVIHCEYSISTVRVTYAIDLSTRSEYRNATL